MSSILIPELPANNYSGQRAPKIHSDTGHMTRHSHQGPFRRALTRKLAIPLAAVSLLLSACTANVPLSSTPDVRTSVPAGDQLLIGKNRYFAVLLAGETDSWESLAQQFYGDAGLYWRIEDANEDVSLKAGQQIVVPLTESSPLGVDAHSVNAVAILAYHSFGNGQGRLTISRSQFEMQMQYLLINDYRVITLEHFFDFLGGNRAIPKRAVMITIDDGHPSTFSIAFPILQRYGFAATVFPYSDYIGNGGVSWDQLRQMQASGLIDVQLHSQTHSDLTQRKPDETLPQLRKRLAQEITAPKALFEQKLDSSPYVVAYPYGAANQYVVEEVQKANLHAGFTVSRGSNTFFSYPYALQRNQIYKDDTIESFGKKLKTTIRLDPL